MITEKPSPDATESAPYEIVMVVIFICIGLALLVLIMTGEKHADVHARTARTAFTPEDLPAGFEDVDFDEPLLGAIATPSESGKAPTFPVPPPPFSDDEIFPCTECHEDPEPVPPKDKRVRTSAHEQIVLNHGPKDRWCFDCHNPNDRDTLRLADGTPVLFEESYRLCGQCHGTIFRDWRAGIHGRRRGFWNGKKSYLLCAHCHNPHAPKFRPIKPLPPPVRPQFLEGIEKAKD